MKLVTAVIQPKKLDHVKEQLKLVGVTGMTVTEVRGFGAQGGTVEMYRGAEATIDMIPKVQLQMVVGDDDLDRVVNRLVNSARTGTIGDGKVWITEVQHVIRIRTGELDLEAV